MKTKFFFLVATLCLVTAGYSQKKWTLQECVSHALENNLTIQQNKLNVEISELNVKTTKGNFLPNLNANTGSSVNFGSGFDPVSQNRVNTSFYGGNLGINSGINIFNGFRNTNTYKQAKLGVESSKLDLEQMQNDISLLVVNSYLNVLFAQENLNVAKVQAEISKKQVEAAKIRYEEGLIPKGDYLNAESTAANDAQNVVIQENALTIALLNLSQLLQVPSEGFEIELEEIGDSIALLLYEDSKEVFDKALTSQPNIKSAELNVENSNYDLEIAKGSFLPTISGSLFLSSDYAYDLKDDRRIPGSTLNEDFFTQVNENLGYGVGFRVDIPIFNRFQTKTNVDRQIVNLEISKLNLENEKLQLEQNIQQALVDAKAAAKTYEAAQISLEFQKEAFKNAQESFNLGAMTIFDFDLVRNRLVSAESTLIRAKYDYIFKTKLLEFYYYGEAKLD